MKRMVYIIILLLVSSCSIIDRNNEQSIYNKCNSFIINIDGSNSLFYTKLKNSLNDKFNLLVYGEDSEIDKSKICEINIKKINIKTYSSLTDTSGITSRQNTKIDIKYSINISNKKINNNCIVFYGASVSDNYYSVYNKEEKMSDNNIEILSDKLFYSIINDISKFKHI